MKRRNGEKKEKGERGNGEQADGEMEGQGETVKDRIPPLPPVSPSPRSPVSLRILLWDIDGTLIRSVRSTGAYKEYMIPVLEEIFGTSGSLQNMRVSGMTDLQIVGEALSDEGFTPDDVLERIHQLSQRLTEEARKVTGNGEPFFELLPGVQETLQTLTDHPRYRSALLTGNIEPMAYLKMELVGLDKSAERYRGWSVKV